MTEAPKPIKIRMNTPRVSTLRVDTLLVEKNLADSRTKAQALIMAGLVYEKTRRIEKPSEKLPPSAELVVKGKTHPYVSRGGVKLKGALEHFKIDPSGKTCLDIGISTGGFTDCLLKEGARKVYGVDVGYGQLDLKLRSDPRVVLFEKTNFRNFDLKFLPEPIDLIVVDVAFISITKLLPKIREIQNASIVALIKPQFEVGAEFVEKGGIVKDAVKREEVVLKIIEEFEKMGFKVSPAIASPITGQDGNVEYLIFAS